MKVVIFGSNGQVARALIATRPDRVDIIPFSRSQGDITDFPNVEKLVSLHQPQVIINCAAYTAVDNAEDDFTRAHLINCIAVDNLVKVSMNYDAKLVHYSTDFVFDGSTSTPYPTTAAVNPISAYGQTKLHGENAVLRSPSGLIIRTAWVYMEGGRNFVSTMLRLYHELDEVQVISDQIGTPTHAMSLAIATWDLIRSNANAIHHFTDSGIASWYDFAVAIHDIAYDLGILKKEVKIIPISSSEYKTAARRPSYSVLDKSKTWPLIKETPRHWSRELRTMLELIKDDK